MIHRGPREVAPHSERRLEAGHAPAEGIVLDRRSFMQIAAMMMAMPSWRPAWARAAEPSRGGTISPRLAALADAWAEEGARFERVKAEIFQHDRETMSRRFYPDPDCSEMRLWRAAKRGLAEASAAVLREPARTDADVILKYHVVDMNYGHRPVDDDDWIELGGGALYRQVWDEAQAFDIELDPFWFGGFMHRAAIGGDPHSPPWAEVARWRYGKFASCRASPGR